METQKKWEATPPTPSLATYIWIVTNRKERQRKGKIQLINAADFYRKMRKSLGNKRNEIGDPDQIAEITRIYGEFKESEHCKIFDNDDFGYRKITVERPLRLSFAVTPERIEALKISRSFESLARSINAAITLVREYRAAFISAAVTGQLNLRKHEKQLEALA